MQHLEETLLARIRVRLPEERRKEVGYLSVGIEAGLSTAHESLPLLPVPIVVAA